MKTPHHPFRTLSALLVALTTVVLSPRRVGAESVASLAVTPSSWTRSVSVDFREEAGPVDRMPEVCVGAGRANEGLRADWQSQLEEVHRECGFTYLRMHGLFTDDMGVYREDAKGQPIYNWQYIDVVYDYLIRIGMKPFVEVGFMPDALASGKQTCFWWHGNVTQPKDWTKWQDFITATVAHWVQRYGATEVKSWYFEIWNEPNLNFFFAGNQQDYFKLYQSTCRAIKTVDSSLRVGGPATAGAAWVPEFLDFCAKNSVPVDFVSTHTYGVGEGFVDETGNKGTRLDPDPHSIARDVHAVRAQIEKSAFKGLPLHFTEWSASYTPSDPIHDSYHSAAFIVDRLRQCRGAAQSMSYWVFTDIFEEAGPRATPFHGGFGLLNYQGIAKPAFYAYQFLHRLGTVELRNNTESSWVTKDPRGRIAALLWDYRQTLPEKRINNQEYYIRDLPPSEKGTVAMKVAHLPAGRYALRLSRVGYRSSDAYTSYVDLGRPSQLTRDQVDYLQSVSRATPIEQEIVNIGSDGVFERNFTVRENDLCLVELAPL